MKTKPELFIRDLGDGLILRHGSAGDADALAEINSRMHSDDGPDKPDTRIGAWTRDLVAKPHPTLAASDFTVVEETATGRIVSTLCLIPQTWKYEGIEFGVGRPELVCTLPEFRNRGLIRIQMEEVHKWSAERGHLMQVITGIPYFYRRFGYDMALSLFGRRNGFEPQVPALKAGETERFNIRPAQESDIDFILQVYESSEGRYAISCKRTPEIVRYELSGRSADNIQRFEKMILEEADGKRVGYFEHTDDLRMGSLPCTHFALVEGVSWLEAAPSVVRYLWKTGREYAARDSQTCTSFGFMLGESHPLYDALANKLPAVLEPYAYYVRVPDLPAFLKHIKPALEKRLAESIAVGHTGELKINFYQSGIRIAFERGCIASIEAMRVGPGIETDASFPDLTFLHLLFGRRTLDEIHHAFADCFWENNTARVLLKALFPKRLSDVHPLS